MITQDFLLRFLRSQPALNLSQIEKEAGIPAKTLHKALTDQKDVPIKHLPALDVVLRRYGYSETLYSRAKVISVVNHKGGVGKTTMAINLGKALSLRSEKVLLVDMDSQGNLSQCFGVHQPEKQVIDALLSTESLPTLRIANVDETDRTVPANGEVTQHVSDQVNSRVYLVPSDIRMAYRETELANAVGADRRLTVKLEEVRSQYSYIIIDCPPSLGICTTCSLVASDYCLIPIQPEASAYFGVENLFNRIADVRTYINPSLTVLGIVFTMVQKSQNVHKSMMAHIRTKYQQFPVFETVIELSTKIKQSQVAALDLFNYDRRSISWAQYEQLANEIIASQNG